MKFLVTYALLLAQVLSCVAATCQFPPFNEADLGFRKEEIGERLREEPSYYDESLPDLRSIMTFGNHREQLSAAEVLVDAGDRETQLRVIYSLKQGNVFGVFTLGSSSPRQVIPYLMEDVAHGSMENLRGNWPDLSYHTVRFAATEIVAGILTEIEEFPESTKEWLQYVESGNYYKHVFDLSHKSKLLVEWWILNEQAFLEERWSDVIPAPYGGSFPPLPKPDLSPAREEEAPPAPTEKPSNPWSLNPVEVTESFEDWSARIIHPERRDLRWVKLTFENGKWMERPPIRLDPLAPPSAPSRSVRRPEPAVAAVEHNAVSHWPVWIAGLAAMVGLLLWWFMSGKTARV